jgi:hypothetical protein
MVHTRFRATTTKHAGTLQSTRGGRDKGQAWCALTAPRSFACKRRLRPDKSLRLRAGVACYTIVWHKARHCSACWPSPLPAPSRPPPLVGPRRLSLPVRTTRLCKCMVAQALPRSLRMAPSKFACDACTDVYSSDSQSRFSSEAFNTPRCASPFPGHGRQSFDPGCWPRAPPRSLASRHARPTSIALVLFGVVLLMIFIRRHI